MSPKLNREFSFLDPPTFDDGDSPNPDDGRVEPGPGPTVPSFRETAGVCPSFEAYEGGDFAINTWREHEGAVSD